jgi:hypothetical protein
VVATTSKFRNAILCEDIRDEVGGKNSLMGVFSGDIVVPSFPAQVNVAFFLQYFADDSDGAHISAKLRLMQDDLEMVNFIMEADRPLGQTATFILPRGVAALDKAGTLRILISVNGAPEEEVLRKQILSSVSSIVTTQPPEPVPPSAGRSA